MLKKKFFDIFSKGPARSIMAGLAIGFTFGVFLFLYLGKNIYEPQLLIIGALMGVVFQVFYEVIDNIIKTLRYIRPLGQILGTIASENTWIYVSAFRVDLKNSKLYRNDPNQREQQKIFGSEFVYGRGDALALTYLFHTLEKAQIRKYRVTVQDSDLVADTWGISAICIGAHNFKTREIMSKLKSCFLRFDGNFTEIIHDDFPEKVNSDGIRFYKAVKKKNLGSGQDIDYGVILKLKDEYHPDKNIIVVAGLGDNGTAGAAYYLYKSFDKLPYKKEEFGVLIEVPSGVESAHQVDFDKVSKLYNT